MTPADILRMAWDSGFAVTERTAEMHLHFAAIVAAAEREACIGECERIAAAAWDKWEQEADGHSRSNAVGAFACIEVIRARGEKP